MILQLPTADPTIDKTIADLREQAYQLGLALAAAEFRAAAYIVRQVWGADAASLLLDMNISDSGAGAADADLLVVLDRDGGLLWFNANSSRDMYAYPGGAAISNDYGRPRHDVDGSVVNRIEDCLEAGYEANDRAVSGALDVASDEHLDFDMNLLVLDVDAALSTT
jgi:hypothetical protein